MRIWIVIAALLGLAVLGLATVPRAIDWNAYRPNIEAAATRLSGHDVTIQGPIEFAVLPRLVLTAKDVVVASGDDEATGFELLANQADITLAFGPLLAGRPVVRDLRLKRPVLTIDPDSSRRMRSWPPRRQDWTLPFLDLDLERIGMTDGRIKLAGDRPDQSFGLRDLSLELHMRGPDGPLEAAGLFVTDHHRFTMTAEFSSPDREGASAAKLVFEAQNGVEETTSLRFNGRVVPFGEDQDLRGRMTLEGPDLQHGLAALSAATGYPSTFQSIATAQPFALNGEFSADRTGVRANDMQLRLAGKLGKGSVDLALHPQEQLDLSVDLPTLRLADRAGLSDFLPLDLLSKLQVPPGEVDIQLRELVYRDNKARKASIKLKTSQDRVTTVEQAKVQLPGLIDLRFEGGLFPANIGPRLRGKLTAVGDDLKSSLTWLGLADGRSEDDGWRSFSLEGDVDVTSVEIALDPFDMRLDSARLQGKAGLRFSEHRRISLDVDINRPNLDLYGAGGNIKSVAKELEDRLKTLDAEVDLRVKKLTWQGIRVEEGSILASAERGQLTLREIAAKIVGDTKLSVSGTLDLNARTADLNTELLSQHPTRALHHLKLDLPLSSRRLRPFELRGSTQGTLETFDLNLEAGYDGGTVAILGEAGFIDEHPRYDLRVRASHPDHLTLASQFGLGPLVPEGDADGPLELTGRLRHQTASPWIASGSAQLGPTTITGSLSYQDAPFTGPFEAKLSVGSPKKDSLAPFLTLTGLRLAGDWTPGRWLGRLPTSGLRTAWLETMEGSLSLASKGGLVGKGLKINAELSDGLLHIDQIDASPWQGKLQAEVKLERRNHQPFATIMIDLDQVEAAEFADWIGVKNGIDAPLDLRLEASSAGPTAYDVMAGLAGDMEIRVGPGELRGLGIPLFRQTLAAETGRQIPVNGTHTMPFREIDAKAELSRGILTFENGALAQNLTADDKTEITIDGTADLLLWIIDLTLAEKTPATTSAPPGAYRLVGPPDRPDGFAATTLK